MTSSTDKFSDFRDVVTSIEDVESVLGEPMPQVLIKEIDHLDNICRSFIAKSPFCVIASANPDGYIDVSPKGDPVWTTSISRSPTAPETAERIPSTIYCAIRGSASSSSFPARRRR